MSKFPYVQKLDITPWQAIYRFDQMHRKKYPPRYIDVGTKIIFLCHMSEANKGKWHAIVLVIDTTMILVLRP